MLKKSSLTLIFFLVGLSITGILFTASEGGFSACPQPIGSPVYLRTISDNSTSQLLQGAQVTGSIQWSCYTTDNPGSVIEYSSITSQTTSSNGTVMLGSVIGNYSITVDYLNSKYSVNFGPTDDQVFLVTLRLPSGTVTTSGCSSIALENCNNTAIS